MRLDNIKIGKKYKSFIIAEVGQSHDGSLGLAHSFIDEIAKSGADAVKFQTHIAEYESTPHDQWRIKFSKQDKSRYDYWKRMEFSFDEWVGLKKHAEEVGLIFLSSPFSIEALEMLEKINVSAFKIPSGEIENIQLLEKISTLNKPLIVSTGMSTLNQIESIINFCKKKKLEIALMQCTSSYPSKAEDIGINVLENFLEKYDFPIGLSDHSGSIFPSLMAMSLGASLIEVHVTFSKAMFGPDISSSINFDDLKILSDASSYFQVMKENPVHKDSIASELLPLKNLFSRSIVIRDDLKSGTIIAKDMLIMKKPGDGIPYAKLEEILGKVINKDLKKDAMLSIDDFE